MLSKGLRLLRLIDLQDLYFDITETYSEGKVTRIDQNRLSKPISKFHLEIENAIFITPGNISKRFME